MSVPESDLTWQGVYDFIFNTLALTENDEKPGVPVDIRHMFVQQSTDVAKVEPKQYHVGGASSTSNLSGRSPSTTAASQVWSR
jgi:hypothetical protein